MLVKVESFLDCAMEDMQIKNIDIVRSEEVLWSGKRVAPVRDSFSPINTKIILCSGKKEPKNHGKAAMGFVKIAAGAAIAFIPIPGAAAIGCGIALKGGLEVASEIGHAEVEKGNSSPLIGPSTKIDF